MYQTLTSFKLKYDFISSVVCINDILENDGICIMVYLAFIVAEKLHFDGRMRSCQVLINLYDTIVIHSHLILYYTS